MANGFSVTIAAKDDASPVVRRISQSFGSLAKSAKQTGQQANDMFDPAALQKVTAGFRDMSFHMRDVVRETLSLGPALSAVASAATVAGVYRLADSFGQLGTRLQNLSQRAAVPIQKLQQLQDAVQLGGGDPTSVAPALASFHDKIVGARDGTDAGAIADLRSIDLFDDKFLKSSTADQFEAVQKKLATLWSKDPTYAERIGSGLMSGFDAIQPALTRPDWSRYESEAASNRQLSPDEAKKADDLRESLVRAQQAVVGLKTELEADLAPALTPIVNDFRDFLQAHNGEIGADIRAFAEQMKQEWPEIRSEVTGFVHDVDAVVRALGGWKTVTEEILALWAGSKFLGVFKTLRDLGGVLGPKGGGGAPSSGGAAAGGGGLLGWLGMLSMQKVALDALTGNAPVPSEDTFQRNDLGHGWLQDLIDRVWGGPSPSNPNAPNGIMPTGPRFGSQLPSPTTAQQQQTARQLGAQFVGAGLTREGAAALLGAGADAESGFNPHPTANPTHAGHFQWDAARQARIAAFFGKTVDQMSSSEQGAAALWEVQKFYPQVWAALHGHDATAANRAVTEGFESPGNYDVETPNRLARTNRDLQYVPAAPDQPVAAAPPSPSGTSGGSGLGDTARIHITTDANSRASVLQQGTGFELVPPPTTMPMTAPQGG